MLAYYRRVTPRVVQMSIGLRAPQVYEETAAYIRRVPESFVQALEGYFEAMQHKGKIGRAQSPHALAMTVFSATFGFIFLKASFEDALTPLDQEAFIRASVAVFAKGIQ